MCFWLLIRILRLWWSCNIDLTRERETFDDHIILIWQMYRLLHYHIHLSIPPPTQHYTYIFSKATIMNACTNTRTYLSVSLSFPPKEKHRQRRVCLPAWSRPFLTQNMNLFFLLHILYSVWLLTTDIIVLCMFHHTYNQIKYCIVRGYLHGWCLCLRYMCVRRQYYIYGESDLLWMNIVFHVTVLL